MKIGLNGATTIKATLEQDLSIAESCGYDYLELWKAKLLRYVKEHSVSELKSLLAKSLVKPYAINTIEFIDFRSEAEEQKMMEELHELGNIASQIGCPNIVVVPNHDIKDVTKEQIHEENVRILKKLSDVASVYKVNLAFEFIGLNGFTVRTLDEARQIVEDVDRENVGLVLDTFHFYTGNSDLEDIQKTDGDKIFIFHMNDSEDLPKERLEDANRLFPGLGVIPLQKIVRNLRSIGYDRMVSIELFRPEYWEMDPMEVGKKALSHTKNVLENSKIME